MKKQIKFRAWNHRYKMMFDVVNIDIDSKPMTGYVNFEGNEGDVWDATFDDKDYTLMQYIGFKDKNGKEICEGDIVRYKEKLDEHGDVNNLEAEVFYAEEYAAFVLGKNDVWNTFNDFGISDIEVISHAFDNVNQLTRVLDSMKYWEDVSECVCSSSLPTGSCLKCDMKNGIDIISRLKR